MGPQRHGPLAGALAATPHETGLDMDHTTSKKLIPKLFDHLHFTYSYLFVVVLLEIETEKKAASRCSCIWIIGVSYSDTSRSLPAGWTRTWINSINSLAHFFFFFLKHTTQIYFLFVQFLAY